MNPERLRLTNVRTFAELDLELPTGCVAVLGANGAGKSTAVNAIDWALFGPDGRSWAPYLTQGAESTELEIELEFSHAETLWRIRHGFSARGAGKTTLDLERMNGAGWEPVTLEGQRATQGHVEEILGLTRETFRASAFLAQGDGSAFTEAKPADRKRILSAVLGLGRFAPVEALVKTDRKGYQQQIERLTGALERADGELAERATVDELLGVARLAASEASKTHTELGFRLDEATRAVRAIEAARAARTDAEAAVARADAVLTPLEHRTVAAYQAAGELAEAEAAVAALTPADARTQAEEAVAAAEARLNDYRTAVELREQLKRDAATRTAQRDAIIAQSESKRLDAAKLDEQTGAVDAGDLADCPTCTQTLGVEARAATLANLRARATVLDDERRALAEQAQGIEIPAVPGEPEPPLEAQQALADARAQLQAAQTDGLKRERLGGAIEILRERVAAAPLEAEVAMARSSRALAAHTLDGLPPAPGQAALAEAQSAALQAKAALEAAVVRLDQAKADEARVAAKAERLDELAKATVLDRTERENLRGQVDRLLVLERAFGRDGIPALIVQGAAIPAIEAEAGRILDELGTSYRVELRTEKALKDGSAADALDVVVITETGERNFETFSGGERTRLNLALRIALARLLASRRGAESRLLAIDEPDGLDEAGMAALARVLQGLNGSFERILLISHVPELRGAFDQTLTVTKGDDGLSRVAA